MYGRDQKILGGETVDIENERFTTDINNRENLYEICVCCQKRLEIPRNQDIEFRPYYIEGAGQLCYDCYQELYRGIILRDNK